MKSFKYTINGNVYRIVINRIEDTIAEVEVNGTPYKVEMNKPTKTQVVTINRPAQTTVAPITRPPQAAGLTALRSPLPGVIVEILCKVGDSVKRGQKLVVLEAMKMENAINSDKDGVIKEIKVNKGDSVLEGTDLIIIE
ncbi:MAG: biotin/lipoyl-binding protein [Candidatus Azobacteroides sp.]|nr:biotin/lipoyl-binding protein [Candidatus Azobacteroides sp.]